MNQTKWLAAALVAMSCVVGAQSVSAETCTKHVEATASGGGDGSAGAAWTLTEAGDKAWPYGPEDQEVFPGDVVCIHPGVYDAGLNVRGSGDPGNRITYRGVPGMADPQLSPTDGTCLTLISWTRVAHIHCTGENDDPLFFGEPEKGPHLVAKGANVTGGHNIIEDSTFEYLAEYGILIHNSMPGVAVYNQVRNNVVRFVSNWGPTNTGNGEALELMNAGSTLVEGNTLEYALHFVFTMGGSTNSVIRGNNMRNPWMKSNTGNSKEGAQVVMGSPGRVVFEGNLIHDHGLEADKPAKWADYALGVGSSESIVRHNAIVHNQIHGIKIQGQRLNPESKDSRIYGNVIYDNGFHGLLMTEHDNEDGNEDVSGNTLVNNIISHNGRRILVEPPPGNSSLASETVQILGYRFEDPDDDWQMNAFDRNNIVHGDCEPDLDGVCTQNYETQPGEPVTSLLVTVHDDLTLAQTQSTYSDEFAGNLEADVAFTKDATDDILDFALPEGSALIGVGAHLTRTESCDGTPVFSVEDASYFSAGLTDPVGGEVLVEGDLIRIGPDRWKIVGVDYAARELTASLPVNCSPGAGVSLMYTGADPDIGFRDLDADGIIDATDNCPWVGNPDQLDSNDDGVGDACPDICSDGIDNDNDGLTDYPDDPGCKSATNQIEDETTQCNDGIDNDGDGRIDYQGGPLGEPADPSCQGAAGRNKEARRGCGLGFELLLLLPLGLYWRRRRIGG